VITVGILGGGQLGRMLALAGLPLGIRCICVEPGADPPAAPVAEIIRAPYGDAAALAELARRCAVVTVELEHVPIDALTWLAERVPVRPGPEAVAVTQDRLAERRCLVGLGIATAPFAEGVAPFVEGTVVKRRRGGYDGRGQVMVSAGTPMPASVADLGPDVISEGLVPFERELSIVAARAVDGTVAVYPVVENRHVDGILRRTRAPAPGLTPALQTAAQGIVAALLDALSYVGVLAVELFEVAGRLVVNELAPRVHNSGHWTIEGAVTSQFEQHLRAICGLPLGDASAVGQSVMVNLIGEVPVAAAVLAVPGAHLHLYDKAPRPARKLGHVTVVGPDAEANAQRLGVI
jgi:5-(carboxyamino)imidazole ribonucleotide synthase